MKSDFNPPRSARKVTHVVRFMSNVVHADVHCNAQEYKESAQIRARKFLEHSHKQLFCTCRVISARAGLSPAPETKARPGPLLNGHPGHTWVSFPFFTDRKFCVAATWKKHKKKKKKKLTEHECYISQGR